MYSIVLAFLTFIHILFSIVNLIDLFRKSHRPKKWEWLFVILCFPFVGVLIYHMTKRRKKTVWLR